MADISRRQDVDRDDDSAETVEPCGRPAPVWTIGDSVAAVSVSRRVYPLRAVLAAAYTLSAECTVLVDEDGDARWALYVIARPGRAATSLLARLANELADHALRAQLEEQFGPVRTLLVAQAFAEGNLLGPEDEEPC